MDPRQVANHDSQHYDIDCVLQLKGSAKRPSAMELLVRWMPNDNMTEETWEPWSGLRDTEALHKYLREKKDESNYSTGTEIQVNAYSLCGIELTVHINRSSRSPTRRRGGVPHISRRHSIHSY